MLTESLITGQTCAVSGASTGMSFHMAPWKPQYTNFVKKRNQDHLVRATATIHKVLHSEKSLCKKKTKKTHLQRDKDCHTICRQLEWPVWTRIRHKHACTWIVFLSLHCFYLCLIITINNSKMENMLFLPLSVYT